MKAPAPTRVVSIVVSICYKPLQIVRGGGLISIWLLAKRSSDYSCCLQAFTTPMVSVMFLGLSVKPAMMPEIVVLDEVT